MNNKSPLFLLLLLISSFSFAQYTMPATGTVNEVTCSGTFTDSGGPGDYTNNNDGTITFCPPTPGDLIQVSFNSFNTEAGGAGCYDFLLFFHGIELNPTVATPTGSYCGNLPTPFTMTSTSPDGCVTFYFDSDSSITRSGWEATVSCITPCTPPTAVLFDTSTINICNPNATNPGSLVVSFDGTNSTAASGNNITSYEWDFGDGTTSTTTGPTTTHTYPSDDEIYIASLTVRDDNTTDDPLGCRSTNSPSKIIRVLPDPDFSGTSTTINITCGSSANLTGLVTSQTETQEQPVNNAGTISLPDGTGVAYTSTLDFTGLFDPTDLMVSGCYPELSFDVEHSASEDLTITLIAPTGESVIVFDGSGDTVGPTGFGTCVNQNDDGVPGCPTTYTIVNAGGSNLTDAASFTTASTPCAGYTGPCSPTNGYPNIQSYFISKTYNSQNPFSTLNGANLNGVWSLEIIDNDGNDDGVLETWSLSFPSSCYSLQTVTPDLTSATWSHSGTGPSVPAQSGSTSVVNAPGPDPCPAGSTCDGTQLSNDVTVGPFPTPGSFTYTLTVLDEFGCEYTQDVTVVSTCTSCVTPVITNPGNQTACDNYTLPATSVIGGTNLNAPLYFDNSQALGGVQITNLTLATTQTVWIYDESAPTCTDEISFLVTISPTENASFNMTATCDGGTAAITGTAGGIFTLNPNPGGSVVIDSGTGEVTGGTSGISYTIEYTTPGTCSALSIQNVTVNSTPAVPTITVVAPTCLADGNSTITNYDNTVTYTFTPVGPTAGAAGLISGMFVGTAYTVTAGNGSCTSVASVGFTNLVMLVTPAVSTITVVAPTCLADGTSTITNYNAALTYTFSPLGPTAGAGGAVSGMVLGTGYTVTAGNGSCTSVSSASFTNLATLAGQPAPTITTVAPICLADGNSTVTNYNAALTYTFTPVGPTVGAGGFVSGMVLGTSYTAIATVGVCISPSSASFTNLVMLVTPAVPTITVVVPTCLADGNSTITNYNGALTYTFAPVGPTAGAGGVISGMTVGTAYTVTSGNGSCTSVASVGFTNLATLAGQPAPTITTVAPTCLADGNSTVTNYNGALTYTFVPVGPTAGAGGVISGMVLGTGYTVTAGNGSCTSVASVGFTNLVMLVTPAVPTITVVAPTCTADGTSTITNYNGALIYTFTPVGPTAEAGGSISGMTLGTAYTVTSGNGSCTSVASAGFTNLVMLVTPPVPTITTVAPTCLADGNSTITNYNGALTYTFSPVGPTAGAGGVVSGMILGTGYTVIAGNGSCTSVASASFTNVAMLPGQPAPTINTISPTCLANGTSTITNYNAALTYTFTPVGPTAGAGGVVSGMILGTGYTVTAGNATCTSVASVAFTNVAMLITPTIPTITVVAPTCLTDGTSTITNYNAALTYVFSPVGPTAGAGGVVSGMVLGTGYTVTAGNGSCTSVTSMPFTNIAMFVMPQVVIDPLFTCDDDNDTFGYFDLAVATTQITGGATNIVVTYHETLAEAEQGVGVIPTGVLYQNVDTDGSGTGDVQELFLNITDTNTGCSYTVETIVLNVIASPELPEGLLTYSLCEDDGSTDGVVAFDLYNYGQNVLLANMALGTVASDYTISFYTAILSSGNPDLSTVIPNPNTYPNTGSDQDIYSSITHNTTGCSTIIVITLHVDLLPVANYWPVHECDDDTANGFYTFNLLDEESGVTGGATGVSVDYFTDLSDAELGTGSSMIPNYASFTNTINPQVIYASVYNATTGCRVVSLVKLHVDANPTPLSTTEITTNLGVMEECDGNVDGSGAISEQVATFDLTQWETIILTGTGPGVETGVSASYYSSIEDAENGVNAIPTPTTFNNTTNPQTIYISVINDGFGVANAVGTGCHTITMFDIYVPVPGVTVVASKDFLCVDANGVPLTNTTLPLLIATAGPEAAASYDYQWMLNGVVIPGATSQLYSVSEPGDYTVTVSGPTDFDCINTSSVQTIEVSGVPDNYNASVTTEAFSDSHQIVAAATSSIPGIVFWYSLDGAEATMNGTFDNVSPGSHIVTITDGEGCWSDTQEVVLIDYPHFFTPNGDGVNDTWRIIHQEGIPISQIYIFDRFGKLLKQLDPDSAGWDGTYNGNQMPATDYWFKIIYLEGDDSAQKEFKAHFSLKR